MENLKKVRSYYQENIYGYWRQGEQVAYSVNEVSKREDETDSSNPFAAMFKLPAKDEGVDVEIKVSREEKQVTFTVRAYLPKDEKGNRINKPCPFIVCMHPIQPREYALKRGYALIFMDTSMVAEDNKFRRGSFYDLYPYNSDSKSQTGELMAWAWGAAKVLDAVYGGLDRELGLDASQSSITGVSRWGKATAVCGAFEKRFKNVIPVCSGAGGLALWNYKSEGKAYNLTHCAGPTSYVYGENEPLSCLQSEAEQGWFVDRFLEFEDYSDIEVDQYMLPMLAADPNRQYFIVAAWMGEDWVNAPAMWACFEKALAGYEKLGLGDHVHGFFHKEGHAVLEEDLEKIFEVI